MVKQALLATTLLLGSALGTAAFVQQTRQPSDDGLEISEDGTQVRLTDEALPGSTGYAAIAVRIPANTTVELQRNLEANHSSDDAAHADFFTFQDRVPHLLAHHADDDAVVQASHEGRSVDCCQRLQGPQGSHDRDDTDQFRPTEPTVVKAGLLAQDWPSEGHYVLGLEASQPLEVLTYATGTEVEAVDLVEQAREQGTQVRVGDRAVVSDPADVHRSWSIDRTGLLALQASVSGQASADLTLELPNGTEISRSDPGPFLHASAATGTGEVSVSLEDVEDSDLRNEDREGFDHLDASVLVADVALDLSGLHVSQPSEEEPLEPSSERITFTEDDLPASSGWYLVKLTANRTTELTIRSEGSLNATSEETKAYMPLVVDRHEERPFGIVASAPGLASVHAADQRVACCPDERGPSASASSSADRSAQVGPEDPVYVALVGVGLEDEDSHEIKLQPADPDADVALEVASFETGETAKAVDLVERAKANGRNVNTGFRTVAGHAGPAQLSLDAEEGVVASVDFHVRGDEARGHLGVELSNGTTIEAGDRNVGLNVGAIGGPGALEVSLTDVELPGPTDTADGEHSRLFATAVVADLPIPRSSLFVDRDQLD